MAINGFMEYSADDSERYNYYRWWLGLTWGDLLDRASDLYPSKIGLVDESTRLTYGQLRQSVDRLAIALLDLGVGAKERVFIQIPNWHEYVVVFFALQKIGAIPVLILPRHTSLEIRHFAALTEPSAWILPVAYRRIDYRPIMEEVLREHPGLKTVLTVRAGSDSPFARIEDLIGQTVLNPVNLERLARCRPDPMEVAQIMPTGGTTGLPKAAPRTHNSFICNVEYHSRAWEITSQDTVLTIAPISHGQGMLCGLGGSIFNFARLVLIDSTRTADICKVIQDERITAVPTVPALIIRLVNDEHLKDYDLSSLQKIYAGGAPSTPALVQSVLEKLKCRFVQAFGSVEGTNAMTRLDDDVELVSTSVGRRCCPYETYKVVDPNGKELPPNTDGELVSRGPGIFTGYFKSEEENSRVFTPDGFLRTGDLARIDEAGNIRITGRIKDIILRGGENISAKEIEDLISLHPKVEDVAVVGMPDQELGERICAYIQKTPEAQAITFNEIIAFLKGKGASVLNLPERIEFVDEMPLTKAGKADKRFLREDIKRRMGLV